MNQPLTPSPPTGADQQKGRKRINPIGSPKSSRLLYGRHEHMVLMNQLIAVANAIINLQPGSGILISHGNDGIKISTAATSDSATFPWRWSEYCYNGQEYLSYGPMSKIYPKNLDGSPNLAAGIVPYATYPAPPA